MKLLITGASGRLGSALQKRLEREHEVIGTDIDTLDVRDFAAVRARMTDENPSFVVHAGAWTDVDGCAEDPDRALQINGYGTQNVAVAAAQVGAPILYVSTNEVFDGQAGRSYREYDRPNPINAYGYSKWVGEQAVQTLHPRHYIVRTSWLFAHGGRNFVQAILAAAQKHPALRVVTDEIANPTYTEDLADAIVRLIATERYGVYHLVNEGSVSRWGFARAILDQAGYADKVIERISIKQWARASTPPAYAGLTNSAATQLGVQLRPWTEALAAFLHTEQLVAGSDNSL